MKQCDLSWFKFHIVVVPFTHCSPFGFNHSVEPRRLFCMHEVGS